MENKEELHDLSNFGNENNNKLIKKTNNVAKLLVIIIGICTLTMMFSRGLMGFAFMFPLKTANYIIYSSKYFYFFFLKFLFVF